MKKNLWAALLIILSLCGASWADVVYTTASGDMKVIAVESKTSFGNPIRVASDAKGRFVRAWGGGAPRVALISPDSSVVDVYNPNDWDDDELDLSGSSSIRSIACSNNGRSVFTASGASIIEYDRTSSYQRSNDYTLTLDGGYTITAQKVLLSSYNVFGLFRAAANASRDVAGVLVRMDGRLSRNASHKAIAVGAHPVDMARSKDGRIAVAYQGATSQDVSGIDTISNNKAKTLVSGKRYGTITSICRDSGNGFYFTGRTGSEGDYTITLYHCNLKGDVETVRTWPGKFAQVEWDKNHGLLVAATDEHMEFRDSDGLLKSFTSADLGGIVTSVTVTSRATSDKNDSGSSGCGALSWGAWPLLFLPLLKRRSCPKEKIAL